MENQQKNLLFEAEGYSFLGKRDASLAEMESKKIEYLESKIDYKNAESILKIYEKAIEDRIFKTPVGIAYLKKLQEFLKNQPQIDIEKISSIPVYVTFSGELRSSQNPARKRVQPAKEKRIQPLPISIALNIALCIAVIAMFVITLNAEQPNILNYEKVITNRYASWEQELTKREQEIKEKERSLKIELEDTTGNP